MNTLALNNLPSLWRPPYHYLLKGNSFLYQLNAWSWGILAFFVFLQTAFYPNFENLSALLACVLAWILITSIYLNAALLRGYPLTSFLIIAFALTQFYFPVIFSFPPPRPMSVLLLQARAFRA